MRAHATASAGGLTAWPPPARTQRRRKTCTRGVDRRGRADRSWMEWAVSVPPLRTRSGQGAAGADTHAGAVPPQRVSKGRWGGRWKEGAETGGQCGFLARGLLTQEPRMRSRAPVMSQEKRCVCSWCKCAFDADLFQVLKSPRYKRLYNPLLIHVSACTLFSHFLHSNSKLSLFCLAHRSTRSLRVSCFLPLKPTGGMELCFLSPGKRMRPFSQEAKTLFAFRIPDSRGRPQPPP